MSKYKNIIVHRSDFFKYVCGIILNDNIRIMYFEGESISYETGN